MSLLIFMLCLCAVVPIGFSLPSCLGSSGPGDGHQDGTHGQIDCMTRLPSTRYINWPWRSWVLFLWWFKSFCRSREDWWFGGYEQDVGKEIHAHFGRIVVGVKLEDLSGCCFMFSKSERKPGWSCGRKSPFQFGKTSHFPPGLEERMLCSQLYVPLIWLFTVHYAIFFYMVPWGL